MDIRIIDYGMKYWFYFQHVKQPSQKLLNNENIFDFQMILPGVDNFAAGYKDFKPNFVKSIRSFLK